MYKRNPWGSSLRSSFITNLLRTSQKCYSPLGAPRVSRPSSWVPRRSYRNTMASTLKVLPTYNCSQDQGTKALVVASVLLGIAIVTVTARLYVRISLRRSLGWDDYTIIASSVSTFTDAMLWIKEWRLMWYQLVGITAFATYVKCIQAGMGKHLLCLTLERIADVAKWSLISQILITVNLCLTKVSVAILVMRVIDKAKRRLTQLLWVLIVFVIISHLVQVLLFCFQCRPIRGVWNPFVKSTCFSTHVTYLSAYVNYSESRTSRLRLG